MANQKKIYENHSDTYLSTGELTMVDLIVDPQIEEGTKLVCRESIKRDGKTVFLEIDGMISSGHDKYEIEIRPVSQKSLFPGQLLELNAHPRYKTVEGVHTDNTTPAVEVGVIEMGPYKLMGHEIRGLFAYAPLKVSGAAIYAIISSLGKFPLVSQLGWFTLVALFDCLLALFPGIHPKDTKRFSTMFSRFGQWAGALVFASALLSVQKLGETGETTGLGGFIAGHVFDGGVGFIISAYSFRIIGSGFKLFYRERAGKVRKKLAGIFGSKIGKFIKDDDLSG